MAHTLHLQGPLLAQSGRWSPAKSIKCTIAHTSRITIRASLVGAGGGEVSGAAILCALISVNHDRHMHIQTARRSNGILSVSLRPFFRQSCSIRPPSSPVTLRSVRMLPNPRACGFTLISGPPVSSQSRRKSSPLAPHVTRIEPSGRERAPYLTAFVAVSCNTKARPVTVCRVGSTAEMAVGTA
jgi:hypothetical protein